MATPTVPRDLNSTQDPKPKLTPATAPQDGLHRRRGWWHFKMKVNGVKHEISTRSRNYQEARRIRAEMVEAERRGQLPTDLARCPFNKVAVDWLAGRKLTVAPKTYSSDQGRLRPAAASLRWTAAGGTGRQRWCAPPRLPAGVGRSRSVRAPSTWN